MTSGKCSVRRILLAAFFLFFSHGDVYSTILLDGDADDLLDRAESLQLPEQADSALSYLDRACTLLKNAHDRSGYLSCIKKRGHVYDKSGRYAESKDEYFYLLQKAGEWFGKNHQWYTTGLTRLGNTKRKLGEYEISLSYLFEALEIRKEHYSNSDSIFASINYEIGHTLKEQGNYQEALTYFTGALELRRSLFGDDHPDVAHSYESIGTTYIDIGKYDDALRYNQKALTIRENILPSGHYDLSLSYLNTGVIFNELGNYTRAVSLYKKALEIRLNHLGELHPDLAQVYNNLANSYNRLGRDDESIKFHHKGIKIRKHLLGEDHLQVAVSYNNMADVYRQRRDYELATHYFKRALAIAHSVLGEDHWYIGAFLNNLGLTYEEMNEYQTAIEHYKEAVEVTSRSLDEVHPNNAIFYNNIGNVYRRQNEYRTSLEYHRRALAIRTKLFGSHHPDIAQSYYNFGLNYQQLQEYDLALDYLNRSLDIRIEALGRHNQLTAATYYDIGLVYRDMGDYYHALEYYHYAIQCLAPTFTDTSYFANPPLDDVIYEARLVDMLIAKGKILHLLYERENNDEYLTNSFETMTLASELVDMIRRGYGSDRSKLLLASRSYHLYENAIDVSLALHEVTGDEKFVQEAFTFAERARASVLWESVMDVHALSFAGIPDTLVSLEENLRSELAYYELQLQKTSEHDPFSDRYRKSYLSLRSEYNALMETIESEYPDFYDLRYNTTVFGPQIVQPLLDDNTAFIQYFLGDDTGYAFVVTSNSVSVYTTGEIPSIRESAHRFNTSLRRFDNAGYITHAHTLYEYLIEPIAPAITGKEKLVIIPDGILHHVPFEALLASAPAGSGTELLFSELDYLLKRFEIVYHYSARLFAHSVEHTQQRDGGHTFAGFAPVDFDTREGEFASVTDGEQRTNVVAFDEDIRDAAIDRNWFASLPHSRNEIEDIKTLFHAREQPAEGFTDRHATVAAFKQYARDYSIVHIASHAFINENNPRLSGIVFAHNGKNTDTDPGVLYQGEIFTLNLRADLVVLSSCESGLGELVRGEGLMAMTRGLMYAGTSNIIVSLWKVYDRHTKELMTDFYSHLLNGNTYSSSLRQAKLGMLTDETTAFPQFWSSFIQIGR